MAGTEIRLSRQAGILVLALHDEGPTGPRLDESTIADLGAAFEMLEADVSLRGAILCSTRSDVFLRGPSLAHLRRIREALDGASFASRLSQLCMNVERSAKCITSLVSGEVEGAGLGLLLACPKRYWLRGRGITLSVPDGRLGLIPTGGVTQRLSKKLPLPIALDVLLGGRVLSETEALELGLLDGVIEAGDPVSWLVERWEPPRTYPPVKRALRALRTASAGASSWVKLKRDAAARTLDAVPDPVRDGIVELVAEGLLRGIARSSELEALAFGERVISEGVFERLCIAESVEALRGARPARAEDDAAPAIAIVGGSLAALALARDALRSSCVVDLCAPIDERDSGERVREARAALSQGRNAARLRLSHGLPDASFLSRIAERSVLFVDVSGPPMVDLTRLERELPPSVLLALLGSAVPISSILSHAIHAQRIVSAQVFGARGASRLLELGIPRDANVTSRIELTRLAHRLGRVPLFVRDSAGLIVTRCLAALAAEALGLFLEGVAIDAIDSALLAWGFVRPVFQRIDDVGLGAAAQQADALQLAYPGRFPVGSLLRALVRSGRLGRAHMRGLYRYEVRDGTALRLPDPSLFGDVGVTARVRYPMDEVQSRCALRVVNEAARCLEEELTDSASAIDVACVLGLGFPPGRGGPLRYIDSVGAAEVVRRLLAYAQKSGESWLPCGLLVDLARRRGSIYAQSA